MLTFVGAPSSIRIKHHNIEFRISVYIPYETLFKLGDFIPSISDGIYEGCCPFNVYIKNHQIICIKNRGTITQEEVLSYPMLTKYGPAKNYLMK